MGLHSQCRGRGEEFGGCSTAKTMKLGVRSSERGLGDPDEIVVPWIFVQLRGHGVDLVEELRVFDVEFPGVDSNNRPYDNYKGMQSDGQWGPTYHIPYAFDRCDSRTSLEECSHSMFHTILSLLLILVQENVPEGAIEDGRQ